MTVTSIFTFKRNRPFSVQNVVDGLKGSVKKTAAQKALESLVESNRITAKEFGKNKAFFPDQSQFEVPSKEEVDKMNKTIADAQSRFYALDAKRKALEQGLLLSCHYP